MNVLTVPKRALKRSRVFLCAQVDPGTGPVDARIRDISSNGALVESDFLPKAGDELQLNCGKLSVPAHVMWQENGWFGVEFATPLMMSRLVDSMGTKLKVSAPRSYRSGSELPAA